MTEPNERSSLRTPSEQELIDTRSVESSHLDELRALLAENAADAAKAAATVHGRRKPQYNADEVRMQLRNYDRTPFLSLLQHWLEAAPSLVDIEKLSARSPDKFVSALTQLARIAGFSEKSETTTNINLNVAHMSDSQLEDELRKAQAALGIGPVIDVESSSVDEVHESLSTVHDFSSPGEGPAVATQSRADTVRSPSLLKPRNPVA